MPHPGRSIRRRERPRRVTISADGPAAPCDGCTVYRCRRETTMRVEAVKRWSRDEELPVCEDRTIDYWQEVAER